MGFQRCGWRWRRRWWNPANEPISQVMRICKEKLLYFNSFSSNRIGSLNDKNSYNINSFYLQYSIPTPYLRKRYTVPFRLSYKGDLVHFLLERDSSNPLTKFPDIWLVNGASVSPPYSASHHFPNGGWWEPVKCSVQLGLKLEMPWVSPRPRWCKPTEGSFTYGGVEGLGWEFHLVYIEMLHRQCEPISKRV